ncbi:MAG: class I SAM-dependent methyltransferase [Clostridiales bacterium]|nr:class I SAM-dependent methyltransferase [Clostridiales bacterium]
MKLSNRMEAVAAMVEPASVLADIGTDHGHVPVALVQRGIISSAIAADVRPGPLSRAERSIAQAGLNGQIQTRLSDGLSQFEPGEADAIVIAGMGGALVIRILKESCEVAHAAGQLIVQPQSEIAQVRRFLESENYAILDEDMVCEDGKFYTVIKAAWRPGQDIKAEELESDRENDPENAIPGTDAGNDADIADQVLVREAKYAYGPVLLVKAHPVLRDYLNKEALQLGRILENIPADGASEQAAVRREEIQHRILINRAALAYIKKDTPGPAVGIS